MLAKGYLRTWLNVISIIIMCGPIQEVYVWNYKKKVSTVMIINSTKINKRNHHLSS